MKLNPLTACDFYKVGHRQQYPQGTTEVYSNFTPRSDALAKTKGGIVFAGLSGFIQWFLIDCWNEGFFNQPKEEVVQHYKQLVSNALVCDFDVKHIEALHDLGYLPIKIMALPEGSFVPMKVPVFTVRNTHPDFFWLPNYLETAFSSEIWKASTTATVAREYKKILLKYAKETGAPLDFVNWQGHDFSLRGLSGLHDGSASGFGHLTSFFGTDTIPAIEYANNYYDGSSTFVGGSVPATEHSVMSAGGKESEIETFRRILRTYPTGVVSIVSDTWDYWKVITEYTKELKDEILARQPNAIGLAKTVFRPDSGDPADIICGLEYLDYDALEAEGMTDWDINDEYSNIFVFKQNGKYYEVEAQYDWEGCFIKYTWGDEIPEHIVKGSIELLWEVFGGTVTPEGYKMLDSHVGLIYGDSITLERAEDILRRLKAKGFASSNVVFGVGSYTYQYCTRDTYGFAMKATAAVINSEEVFLSKDPKTDKGTKKSATGYLAVKDEDGVLKLVDGLSKDQLIDFQGNQMRTVFLNGLHLNKPTLEQIRQKVDASINKELV